MAYVGNPIDTQNTFQSLQGKRFDGDGSTTDFTLDVTPGSTLDIEVFVGNVRQDPNSAYTVSGTTLSFTGAPPSGTNNIYVVHQAKSVGTIDVPALGVSTASIQSSAVTTAKINADAITEAKIADDAVESEHLNNNIISGQTELASAPDSTDELLISDGGTLKRIDVSLIGGTNTPYFEAVISSAQDVSDNTYTKIAMSVENLDSANAYDNSSNYRFTPQTAGKYYCYLHINGLAANAGNGNMREIGGSIYKNGSRYAETFHDHNDNDGRQGGVSCMAIITFNGSSDYIEAYGYVNTVAGGDGRIDHSGSPSARTRFGAFKIIE